MELDVLPLTFSTDRLLLRRWRETDVELFCKMNADSRVMEFFPSTLTAEQTERMIQRIETHFQNNRFGLWAVEVPGESPFIGFVGLQIPQFEAPFTPCVEIGWRLAAGFWGRGLATEAARKVLAIGFRDLELEEIVSMTAVINIRSRRVMEKIGMRYSPADDFDHPCVPAQSRVNRHVLYRLNSRQYFGNPAGQS